MDFLNNMLGPLLSRKIQGTTQSKREKRYYGKLYRLCKKHNITYSRDETYWDFSKPIGTIGMNEDVDSYESAYKYVKEKLS